LHVIFCHFSHFRTSHFAFYNCPDRNTAVSIQNSTPRIFSSSRRDMGDVTLALSLEPSVHNPHIRTPRPQKDPNCLFHARMSATCKDGDTSCVGIRTQARRVPLPYKRKKASLMDCKWIPGRNLHQRRDITRSMYCACGHFAERFTSSAFKLEEHRITC